MTPRRIVIVANSETSNKNKIRALDCDKIRDGTISFSKFTDLTAYVQNRSVWLGDLIELMRNDNVIQVLVSGDFFSVFFFRGGYKFGERICVVIVNEFF